MGKIYSEMLFLFDLFSSFYGCFFSGSMMFINTALSICNFPQGIEDNLKLLRSENIFFLFFFWLVYSIIQSFIASFPDGGFVTQKSLHYQSNRIYIESVVKLANLCWFEPRTLIAKRN